jgi:hypothetical protein
MRRFILEVNNNFSQSALEGDVHFLEDFMIDAIRVYRQQDTLIPNVLLDALPIVHKTRMAVDSGTWQDGQAPELQGELDDFASEFAHIDHNALADALLAVGVDVHEDYKKNRDNQS